MAMLAHKTAFPQTSGLSMSAMNQSIASPMSSSVNVTIVRRPTNAMAAANNMAAAAATSQSYASPTNSDFSHEDDGPDSVRYWDEQKVCEYLRSVKCGDYETLFRQNHINGENLLELDKDVLKEMGIDKVGDRVRLFLGIKKLRTQAYANQKKRNRVSVVLFVGSLFLFPY